MLGINRTQTRHIKGGTHCIQRGSHGHHEQTGLHQHGAGIITRQQDLQSSQQRQTHTNTKGLKTTCRTWWPKIQETVSHKCCSPMFNGLPKIHKVGTPIRPIVSSRGSITHGVAKEVAYFMKPLIGQSPHHLKNTQHFVQQIHNKKAGSRWGNDILWCQNPFYLSTSGPLHPNSPAKIGTGSYLTTKDQHVQTTNSYPHGVLP